LAITHDGFFKSLMGEPAAAGALPAGLTKPQVMDRIDP